MSNTAGIEALNIFVEMKLENANEAAGHAATSARDNINQQKSVRAAMRQFEDIVRKDDDNNGIAEITWTEAYRIEDLASGAGLDTSGGKALIGAGDIGIEGAAKTRADKVDQVRAAFQDRIKDLEDADKLSNFDIQDLSTRVTQMMNAQSTLTKKIDSAEDRVLSNIG